VGWTGNSRALLKSADIKVVALALSFYSGEHLHSQSTSLAVYRPSCSERLQLALGCPPPVPLCNFKLDTETLLKLQAYSEFIDSD
jgi:hypothetical protein